MDTYGIWHSEINRLKQYYQVPFLSPLHYSITLPNYTLHAGYHTVVNMAISKPTTSFQLNIPCLKLPEIQFPSLLKY